MSAGRPHRGELIFIGFLLTVAAFATARYWLSG